MTTHQCSHSDTCNAGHRCMHAKPHTANGCNSPAPCGVWPDNPGFRPMVQCIPVEQVKPLEDCLICGAKEAKGHHPQDCIQVIKRGRNQLQELALQLCDAVENNDDLPPIKYALKCGYLVNKVRQKAQEAE